MKIVSIILLTILLGFTTYAYEWETIYKFPSGTWFEKVSALDSSRFVVCGSSTIGNFPDFEQYSFVAITKNGGYDWEYILKDHMDLSIPKNNIFIGGVAWIDDTTIIAGIEGGIILKTTNLGKSWDSLHFEYEHDGRGKIYILNYNRPLISAKFSSSKNTYISDDNAITWDTLRDPKYEHLSDLYNVGDIQRFGKNTILFTILNPTLDSVWIAITTDRGNQWDINFESDDYNTNFTFFDTNLGFMGGLRNLGESNEIPLIKKSTDMGRTWEVIFSDEGALYKSPKNIVFYNKNNNKILFAQSAWAVLKSIDGGVTWSKTLDYTQGSIKDAAKIECIECSMGNCLIFDNDEQVMKFVGPISNASTEILDNNFNSYPNPLPQGQSLNIEIEMENSGNVTIDLINLLGVKVANIYEGYLSAGKRTFFKTFKENLPAGTYYLTMTVNGKDRTVKAVVLE